MSDVEIQKEKEGKAEEAPVKKEPTESLVEVADRLEKANAEAREILNEQREMAARNLLGGRADAGQTQQLSEEDKKKQGAKEFWAGSGIDKSIEKYG